ncbi:PqqD family protein [Paraprevotella xylaniphila]|uniref:PqqD family protein n=1 Tax=Paraprevotella xylaniphila TaxID=454155 RepID=UPI00266DC83F|nr:PqqD family protein [Paraprevotella xylaniphila]
MRIKEGFELREICGEHVILSHGMDNIDFSKIISLNETAAFLWKQAVGKEAISEDGLVSSLLEAYEVDEETAVRDVARCLAKWREIGLLA